MRRYWCLRRRGRIFEWMTSKMIVEVRLHLKGRVMMMVTKQMTMKKNDKKIVCKNVICKNKCYK